MKTKLVTIFLCITTILTGCTGQENKNHQDGQEIATLNFNDIIQDMDIQNSESEENTPDLKNQANVISSGTLENDGSTESAAGTEASAGQSQEVSDSSQKNKTAQDLYTGFIKNEVPVIIAEDYPQNDYKTYNLEPNKSYTFTQLGEFVNTSYYDPEYSTKTSYDDVQYAYLDCANSDAKNLLVKFSGLGIYAPDDDSFAVYVITENNGQLYLTDSYECWARSGMRAYKNGLFVSDGSGGAGEHYAGVSALMPDGKITDIYEAVILTGWCVRYVGRETIYNEVFSGNEDIIFTVMVYTIGEKMFYIYDLSECTADQISVCETYISRCRDEADIEWVTEEVVEEAIKNQCGLLGIDYNAIEQQEDMEWITCYNSHQRQFSSAYKLLRCEL